MAESSTPEEMLSSDESSVILYVTEARVLRVEFTNCQSWPHETSWTCLPTPNLSLNTPKLRAQLGELKERWESRGEHLTSIRSGSLIFVFGHDTEDEAIQMAARHSEIKKAILLFLHEIGSEVKNISMEAVVQEAKRTAKKQQKESGQIITGMDGDSTAIHSNVSRTQNVQELHQELGNIHIDRGVFYINCEVGTHETSWHCNPAPNKHIFQVPGESFHRFGRRIRKFFRARLRRVALGSLIFSFAHTTSEDAIDMIVKHRNAKEVFLDFVQELDPSIEDIRIEVVLRELSVSEEQTTQITETRPRGMPDPEHKDEKGTSRSYPQQKDDDDTSHPHIQETGDMSSSPSHSLQKKDEDTCLPHPQKTEEDKTSLQQTDEDTSHLHPEPIGMEKGVGSHSSGYTSSDPSLKPLVKGQDSDRQASSDPSQDHSQSEEDPWFSTASRATLSPADLDLYLASWAGDLEKVKRLLSTPGVNVDCRVGRWNMTPVMAAAYKGHRDVVELLVSEGADVSPVDVYSHNILHLACRRGHVETVKFVLSLNVVDINARNMWGQTAADEAGLMGRQQVVELLKSRGPQ